MPPEASMEFDGSAATSDPNSRTIRGIALPPQEQAVTQRWGRTLRIISDSVTLSDRVPLLRDHDDKAATGKLISSEWTDAGLEVVFKVSKTPSGDEILQLANDGVLGLSLGLRFTEGDVRQVGDELHLSNAVAIECSTTTMPALPTSLLAVNMSAAKTTPSQLKKVAMSDREKGVDVAALSSTMDKLNETLVTLSSRPVPQPVAVVTREEPLYDFGNGGQHDFPTDLKLSLAGDHGAAERIERHFVERFAVTQGNAAALVPQGYKPELTVDERPFTRTLPQVISTGTIANNAPFGVPFLKNATGPWVSSHVAGIEPTEAGGAVWDTQTITPKPMSGKVSILQEALDLTGGQVANLLWTKFLREADKVAEKRIADLLDGLTLPADQVIPMTGENADLADAFDEIILDLAEPDRFAGMAADSATFKAFFRARDEDKRKLFPPVGAVNADGTSNTRRSLDLNGVFAFKTSTQHAYLVDKSTVWQWTTVPTRFDLKTRVASLEIGFWQYEVSTCIDTSGVVRIEYTA